MTVEAETECSSGLPNVEEARELQQLVDRVAASQGVEAVAVFPRFAQIVRKTRSRKALRGCRGRGIAAELSLVIPRCDCPCCPPSSPKVSKYQEQAQLLDPLLEGIIQPLAAILRTQAAEPHAAELMRVRGVSRLLWQLSVVR